MKVSKLHVIYSLLLAHCFVLRADDEKQIRKQWGFGDQEIYGEQVEWIHQVPRNRGCAQHVKQERVTLQSEGWQAHYNQQVQFCRCADPVEPKPVKICSMPTAVAQVISANVLARDFDLEGVPGFYREDLSKLPADPSANLIRWLKEKCGPWRLNLNYKAGLLVPYTNGSQWIVGLRIYRGVRDRHPSVLTSRGLPGGAKAIGVQETIAA